jgi:hypothetical protein
MNTSMSSNMDDFMFAIKQKNKCYANKQKILGKRDSGQLVLAESGQFDFSTYNGELHKKTDPGESSKGFERSMDSDTLIRRGQETQRKSQDH